MRRKKPLSWLKIARERINILFREAKEAALHGKLALATRYVFLARKIGMKYNISLGSEKRRQFCHKCYRYLLPGKNCIVRTNPKTKCVEYRCKECGHINRYGYSKEKKN